MKLKGAASAVRLSTLKKLITTICLMCSSSPMSSASLLETVIRGQNKEASTQTPSEGIFSNGQCDPRQLGLCQTAYASVGCTYVVTVMCPCLCPSGDATTSNVILHAHTTEESEGLQSICQNVIREHGCTSPLISYVCSSFCQSTASQDHITTVSPPKDTTPLHHHSMTTFTGTPLYVTINSSKAGQVTKPPSTHIVKRTATGKQQESATTPSARDTTVEYQHTQMTTVKSSVHSTREQSTKITQPRNSQETTNTQSTTQQATESQETTVKPLATNATTTAENFLTSEMLTTEMGTHIQVITTSPKEEIQTSKNTPKTVTPNHPGETWTPMALDNVSYFWTLHSSPTAGNMSVANPSQDLLDQDLAQMLFFATCVFLVATLLACGVYVTIRKLRQAEASNMENTTVLFKNNSSARDSGEVRIMAFTNDVYSDTVKEGSRNKTLKADQKITDNIYEDKNRNNNRKQMAKSNAHKVASNENILHEKKKNLDSENISSCYIQPYEKWSLQTTAQFPEAPSHTKKNTASKSEDGTEGSSCLESIYANDKEADCSNEERVLSCSVEQLEKQSDKNFTCVNKFRTSKATKVPHRNFKKIQEDEENNLNKATDAVGLYDYPVIDLHTTTPSAFGGKEQCTTKGRGESSSSYAYVYIGNDAYMGTDQDWSEVSNPPVMCSHTLNSQVQRQKCSNEYTYVVHYGSRNPSWQTRHSPTDSHKQEHNTPLYSQPTARDQYDDAQPRASQRQVSGGTEDQHCRQVQLPKRKLHQQTWLRSILRSFTAKRQKLNLARFNSDTNSRAPTGPTMTLQHDITKDKRRRNHDYCHSRRNPARLSEVYTTLKNSPDLSDNNDYIYIYSDATIDKCGQIKNGPSWLPQQTYLPLMSQVEWEEFVKAGYSYADFRSNAHRIKLPSHYISMNSESDGKGRPSTYLGYEEPCGCQGSTCCLDAGFHGNNIVPQNCYQDGTTLNSSIHLRDSTLSGYQDAASLPTAAAMSNGISKPFEDTHSPHSTSIDGNSAAWSSHYLCGHSNMRNGKAPSMKCFGYDDGKSLDANLSTNICTLSGYDDGKSLDANLSTNICTLSGYDDGKSLDANLSTNICTLSGYDDGKSLDANLSTNICTLSGYDDGKSLDANLSTNICTLSGYDDGKSLNANLSTNICTLSGYDDGKTLDANLSTNICTLSGYDDA